MVWFGWGVALILGCGARAFPTDEGDYDEVGLGQGGTGGLGGTGGSGGSGGSGGLGGSGGGGGSGGSGGSGSTTDPFNYRTTILPACELGFVWQSGDDRPCKYRLAGRCYNNEISVCACACPREGNSVCALSGILGDTSRPLQVSCGAS
jgi:hypothetical protein